MDQIVSVPIHDRDEENPLLGSHNGSTRNSKRGLHARTIFCLVGLFVTGIVLGQRFKSTPGNADLRPPPSPPVCNLDHADSDTFSYYLNAAPNFQILDITFDEGIVGNIVVNVNDDPSVRDIAITRTLRFNNPEIEQAFKGLGYESAPHSSMAFTAYYSLDYTRRERQRILYEKHQCAGVDLVITVPKVYPLERLDLKSNYKGNIEIQSIDVETLNVKVAHGNIYIRDTFAAVSVLDAPAGAIDAQVTIDTRLRTSSSEDTTIDFMEPFHTGWS